MKNIFLILLLTYTLPICSQQIRDREGFLWKISKNGMENPSYLYGTIHSFSGKFIERVPRFHDAFRSIKQLIVEIDSIDVTQISLFSDKYKTNRFLPKGIKYSDLLDEKDIQYLDSILMDYWHTTSDRVPLTPNALYEDLKKKYSEDMKILENFAVDSLPIDHPFRYMIRLNKEGDLPMDIYIKNKAEKYKYNIIGLESLEYQMKLKFHYQIPLEIEAKSLISKLRNHDKLVDIIGRETVDAGFAQDLNAMMQCFDDATRLSGLGSLYALSPIDKIKERNQNWISIIEPAITRQPSMIAVGAGHLPGEYGLIALLRQKGYIVEEFK